MFDSLRHAFDPSDDTQAKRLAAAFVEASGSWAKALVRSIERDSPALRQALSEEVLAYAVCVLDLRLRNPFGDSAHALVAEVRKHCRQIRDRKARPSAHKAFSEASTGPAEFAERYWAVTHHVEVGPRFREDIWREFCRTTGLGTNVLVGNGNNLAALIFYIVVHSRVLSEGPACREAATRLLRVAHDCVVFFDAAVDQWLAEKSADRSGLPTPPPAPRPLSEPARRLGSPSP
jgi:hypothetical protein